MKTTKKPSNDKIKIAKPETTKTWTKQFIRKHNSALKSLAKK